MIAGGGGSGDAIWFWKGMAERASHTIAVPASARDLALHPAGDRFAVAGADGTAYLYVLPPRG